MEAVEEIEGERGGDEDQQSDVQGVFLSKMVSDTSWNRGFNRWVGSLWSVMYLSIVNDWVATEGICQPLFATLFQVILKA